MVDSASVPRFVTVGLNLKDQPVSTARPVPVWTVLRGPEMPGYRAVTGKSTKLIEKKKSIIIEKDLVRIVKWL